MFWHTLLSILQMITESFNDMEIKERIKLLLAEMNNGVYEKDTEIGLALLAALAGDSILLLGPPGVAKSMIARRLKNAFANAKSFEYLMSRFSTPDEIFGPISLSRLKLSDKYERNVKGYLPTADVVFLDEIWKAGPAIQNTLLTVINEKVFRNGDKEIQLPLKLLVAASNELPAQGEGLEALWDRFLIRTVCTCIQQEELFYKMLLNDIEDEHLNFCWRISNEEYLEWKQQIKKIIISSDTLSCITEIRRRLKKVDVGEEGARSVYVSDRRWKCIIKMLKASAFMHGRTETLILDLLPIYHCLWNEPCEYDSVQTIVIQSLFLQIKEKLSFIVLALKADLKVCRVHEALKNVSTKDDHRGQPLRIVDHFYYQVAEHGTGNTYIFISDYINLPDYKKVVGRNGNAPVQGILYRDPQNLQRMTIRTYSGNLNRYKGELVTLYRDDKGLYINGVRFPIIQLKKGEKQQFGVENIAAVSKCNYEVELETISTQLENLVSQISGNLFVSQKDNLKIEECSLAINKEIALARVDVQKLQYATI